MDDSAVPLLLWDKEAGRNVGARDLALSREVYGR